MRNLLLFFNEAKSNNIMLDHLSKEEGTVAFCVFKPVNVLFRMFRRFHLLSGLPGIGIWLLPWVSDIQNFETIIMIASPYSIQILQWIKKKHPDVRCINYYWDSLKVSGYPYKESSCFENWSFFEEDSKKYGMFYNPQFYVQTMNLPKRKIVYDVSYVGADRGGLLKDRTEIVLELLELFGRQKICSFFYYVTSSQLVPDSIRKDKIISEEKYHEVVAQSRVVVDIVEKEIQWQTLRPLLALTNKKKLITNNVGIRNEKYYSPENIFILGKDDSEKLKDFVNSDFVSIDPNDLNFYNASSWLSRFYSNEKGGNT